MLGPGRPSRTRPGHPVDHRYCASVCPVHFVIMGCGRVGSTLALILEGQGHSVAVIDSNESAFRRLGTGFSGKRVNGIGFDRETLTEAGIEEAEAFAAVSSGDNSNIVAARVARETFGVDNVVARIYDPGRAEVYQRLGIPTVATVRWTADQMLRRLLPHGTEPEWRDPSGTVQLAEVIIDTAWVGERISRLEEISGGRVAFLTRFGEGLLPGADTVLQDGDLVHVVMKDADADAVEGVLRQRPSEVP
jgi:trk/ktr system potassium uptake protein